MTAQIVAFPIARRVGLIRKIAEVGSRQKSAKQRKMYWSRRCRDLASQLRKHGASDREVQLALHELANAVRTEVAALKRSERSNARDA